MMKKCFGLLFAFATGVSFAANGAADKVQVADNAPDSYVVKKGDTLWAISGVFLKQPWRWPEVWRMNQAQIHNPHLIYPGQIVVLDRNGPTLSLGRNVSSGGRGSDERLSPKVYSQPVDSAITSVPLEAIRQFLAEPLVDDSEDDGTKPAIVGIQEERVVGGVGDTVFAKNLPGDVEAWHVYRRGSPIKDPVSEKVLGYEAQFVATARATVAGSGNRAAEMRIIQSKYEVTAGDRLMPAGKTELMAFAPHAPSADLAGNVASIYGGVGSAGRYSVITVSRGKDVNLEPGHVVALYRNRGSITYRADGNAETYNLPDNRLGLAYIFRVFNHLSYALIMDAAEPVNIGDKVTAP